MIWKITLPSNQSCVLSSEPRTYDELLKAIHEQYDASSNGPFTLKYKDAEEELINLCSSEDFDTAILSAKKEKLETLQIFVIPTVQNQINKNNLNFEQLASLINNQDDVVKPFPRRTRQSSTYGPSKSYTGTPKNAYKTKLPVINEANILQKGQATLTNFGKRKRTSSCPILERGKYVYPRHPEQQELNISPQDLKSICLGFLEKFAEEKINNKVKQEVKDVIPVLIELLKDAWRVNAQKTQSLQQFENSEKICCQCNRPAKPVSYICTGCLKSAEFAKELAIGGSDRIYQSFDSAKLLQAAKEDSFRLEAKRMNNNLFSPNSYPGLRKRNSKRIPDRYKVSLLRVRPEVQQVKARESYKVSFELKNNGDVKWPDNVKLVCINGLHKGNEKILPALEPGRKITVELSLPAPKEDGKYLSQWRVSYGKGRKLKSFGESIFEEIHVTGEKVYGNVHKKEVKKEENVERERGRQGQEDSEGSERKKSTDSWSSVSSDVSESGVPKKIRCQEDRIKCAKFLNEMFPGDLEEKINFIKKFLEEVTIFDVVEKYLMTLGKSKTRGDRRKYNSQICSDKVCNFNESNIDHK